MRSGAALEDERPHVAPCYLHGALEDERPHVAPCYLHGALEDERPHVAPCYLHGALFLVLISCRPAPPGASGSAEPPSAMGSGAPSATAAVSASASPVASGSSGRSDAGPVAQPVLASRPGPIPSDDVEHILFPHVSAGWSLGRCPKTDVSAERRVRCLLELRYETDADASRVALELFDQSGSLAGTEREYLMDGGFRGKIRLVPEPPIGKYRRHLEWVTGASREFEKFFAGLEPHAKSALGYRWRSIAYKFFRSVGRTTPSAYADGWTIAYNVSGSLHGSAEAVRETLFHEIFHLNDAARHWSRPALGAAYDGIVAKCGTKVACLTPYAPNTTMVRGGTYYAFQPDNGDGAAEYAAELAVRYYRETGAALRGDRLERRAFKCGPEENARSWALLVTEFFGGVDLVPPC